MLSLYDRIRWNSKITKLCYAKKVYKSSVPPKITLSMCVKNEASAYLSKMLSSCKEYIDYAVIIDDASADNTVEVCEQILNSVPHTIVKNKISLFATEWKLRMLQWAETIKTKPEWILFLDADQIFEDSFKLQIRDILSSDESICVYKFRLYDMWDDCHYRSDPLWTAHHHYEAFMLRYDPSFKYFFTRKTNQHCGHMPSNVKYLKSRCSDLRLKHYGWANEEKRKEKFNRYMELDPEGKDGSFLKYQSVLDENPHLVEWFE